jgi:predicted RNA methylase
MILSDPEGYEIAALLDLAGDLAGLHVLEIGVGTGRLTWRYAHHAARVTAIDPDADRVAAALAACPADLRGRVTFVCAGVESLPAGGDVPGFDLALLSWSL